MNYMLMSLPGGNALESYDDLADAYAALLRILWKEPEARDSVGLVAFNKMGTPVRRLWPDPE